MAESGARLQPSADRAGSRKIWSYVLLAFGISWGAYFFRLAGSWGPGIDEALRLTVKFGPSLAGIGVAAAYGGAKGVWELIRRLRIPFSRPRWILLAFGLPLLILIAAVPIRALVGGPLRPFAAMSIAEGSLIFGSLLATRFFLGGGLGEELGWRGVMLPALQSRVGALQASLIIGVVHGAWHLPAYGPGVLFLTLFTVSGSILFTWMYNNTEGNLFLPALMHATANASLPFLEQLVPNIDGEILFPMLVFGLWATAAWLLLWRLGPNALEPTGAGAGAI